MGCAVKNPCSVLLGAVKSAPGVYLLFCVIKALLYFQQSSENIVFMYGWRYSACFHRQLPQNKNKNTLKFHLALNSGVCVHLCWIFHQKLILSQSPTSGSCHEPISNSKTAFSDEIKLEDALQVDSKNFERILSLQHRINASAKQNPITLFWEHLVNSSCWFTACGSSSHCFELLANTGKVLDFIYLFIYCCMCVPQKGEGWLSGKLRDEERSKKYLWRWIESIEMLLTWKEKSFNQHNTV